MKSIMCLVVIRALEEHWTGPGLFLGCMGVHVCASMPFYTGDRGRGLSRWESSGALQGPGVLEEPVVGSAEAGGVGPEETGAGGVGWLGRAVPATVQRPWATLG